MLCMSKNNIHIQHVMWQPIFRCQKGCNGCYVASSTAAKYEGKLVTDILDLIFTGEKVTCDQLTISLDTMTTRHDELTDHLMNLWWLYKQGHHTDDANTTQLKLNEKKLPELCVTVHNYTTLNTWAKWMHMSLQEFLQPLTVLSLSRFPSRRDSCEQLQFLTKKTKTILNYNRLSTKFSNTTEFRNGCEFADQIHLVYKKNPLGQRQSCAAYDDMKQTYVNISSLEMGKVTIDKCIRDARKEMVSGFKCDAAIHKVHVWPDGTVTGCPYDSLQQGHKKIRHRSLTHPYSTWDELRSVITQRVCHPMSCCLIPNMLKEIQNRAQNSVAPEGQQG